MNAPPSVGRKNISTSGPSLGAETVEMEALERTARLAERSERTRLDYERAPYQRSPLRPETYAVVQVRQSVAMHLLRANLLSRLSWTVAERQNARREAGLLPPHSNGHTLVPLPQWLFGLISSLLIDPNYPRRRVQNTSPRG